MPHRAIVKMIPALYSIFHGFVVILFGLLCVATVAVYGDWLQTVFVAVIDSVSFVLLATGVFVDVML